MVLRFCGGWCEVDAVMVCWEMFVCEVAAVCLCGGCGAGFDRVGYQ